MATTTTLPSFVQLLASLDLDQDSAPAPAPAAPTAPGPVLAGPGVSPSGTPPHHSRTSSASSMVGPAIVISRAAREPDAGSESPRHRQPSLPRSRFAPYAPLSDRRGSMPALFGEDDAAPRVSSSAAARMRSSSSSPRLSKARTTTSPGGGVTRTARSATDARRPPALSLRRARLDAADADVAGAACSPISGFARRRASPAASPTGSAFSFETAPMPLTPVAIPTLPFFSFPGAAAPADEDADEDAAAAAAAQQLPKGGLAPAKHASHERQRSLPTGVRISHAHVSPPHQPRRLGLVA